MTEHKRVLVVIDPTAQSHPALERAAWLAKYMPASLELCICDYTSYLADSRLTKAAETLAEARASVLDAHERRLQELAKPLTAAGLTATVDARWDYPLHDAIVRKTLDFRADLVLKDTHYHSVLKRAIFSNTDWNLIRNCPAALLLVKPRAVGAKPCFVAAVDPLHERDKPASLDHRILTLGAQLCAAVGGELHAFHAFDIAAAIAVSSDSMTMPIALPVRELMDAMRTEHTAAVYALTDAHRLARDRVHIQQGGTRELLLALTERLHADVLVMGAVSRSGLKGLFLGNTAEDMLDRLHCDLLIVKPEGFAATLP
jgi:universal stress protein E